MQQKSITADTSLWADIDEAAELKGITRSEWMREAARQKLQIEEYHVK